MLTIQFHSVQTLYVLYLHPPYTLVIFCFMRHKDNYIFTFHPNRSLQINNPLQHFYLFRLQLYSYYKCPNL